VGQLEDRCGRHRDGWVLDLDVDALDGERRPLLEVLDRGHGLVRVPELGQQVAQPRIGVGGVR
jgi:hypothetical protein